MLFSESWPTRDSVVSPILTISIADQPTSTSTAAKKSQKKGGGIVKRIWNLIKRPKPGNDPASQNSASVSSAVGAHDPVPENDGVSRFINLGVINDNLASPDGNATMNQGMYYVLSRMHNSQI
jgi:hypothetical protein